MKLPRMTADIRRRRLLHLADILRAVPSSRFDMSVWGVHEGTHEPEADNYCGTAACALGWAALDPQFRRAGLVGTWRYKADYKHRLNINNTHVPQCGLRVAGALFFGLTDHESRLFTEFTGKPRPADIRRKVLRLADTPFDAAVWRVEWDWVVS